MAPCLVVSINNQPAILAVHVPHSLADATAQVRVESEDGKTEDATVELGPLAVIAAETTWAARCTFAKRLALTHKLPLGYHTVRVSVADLPQAEMRLIVTPDRAYLPRFLEDGGRSAGIAVTLYGLRSAHNWGCGDFRDLRALCEWAAKEVGVSFIALNPAACHSQPPTLQRQSLSAE